MASQKKSSSYGSIPQEDPEANNDGSFSSLQSSSRSFLPLSKRFSSLLPEHVIPTSPILDSISIIRNSSFALHGDDCSHHHHPPQGTCTISSEVANMTKNLIGGGVLSLSGGIAVFSNSPNNAVPIAIGWTVLLGGVFGYFCLLIGKSCRMTHSATYRECWERTVGHKGGLTVAIVNTLDPLLGCFANASILSQSLQLLLEGSNIYWSVVVCLLVVTLFGILPLCLFKNLNALAPFSAMGMAAVLCALGAMLVRYMDGSYQPGGQYYAESSISREPFGTRTSPWYSTSVLPFVCMVYTSFDMHYNSPRFYAELKDASLPRFGQVVFYSFGLTAVVYFSIAVVGFLTFGQDCDSYILNNYSPKDSLATASRIAIGLCSLVSYPLNFIGVRDNCLDILGITDQIDTDAKLNVFTIMMLSILTLISCFVTDLGLINSVGGGTTVTLVCFIFPAIMFHEGIQKYYSPLVLPKKKGEVWFAMNLALVFVLLGIVGVWSSLVYGA